MNYRWIYAVLWVALIAGFVYLRNRMNMGGLRPPAPSAQPETSSRRWAVPPLAMLPSDTMKPEYAAAHFSGSAYRAWMNYNDTLSATAPGSATLNSVTHGMADSLSSAAHVALGRLQIRIPESPALSEFRSATARMDSIVTRAKQAATISDDAALTELHNQTFELLRQLTALK